MKKQKQSGRDFGRLHLSALWYGTGNTPYPKKSFPTNRILGHHNNIQRVAGVALLLYVLTSEERGKITLLHFRSGTAVDKSKRKGCSDSKEQVNELLV